MSALFCIFYPPASIFMTALSIITFLSNANLGISEIRGKHIPYSKFWNISPQESSKTETLVPARIGMFISYVPAFLLASASFLFLPDEGPRFVMLKFSLTLHFLKRIYEVAFVHRYSSKMHLKEVIVFPITYLKFAICMFYYQHQTLGLPDPILDLKYLGMVFFLVGIGGNFYHHLLLSSLRKNGDQTYKIPRGGLFEVLVCPHYVSEIVEFLGFTMIAQTIYPFFFTSGATIYFIARSYSTKRWYLSKFEDFPGERKILIPYVL